MGKKWAQEEADILISNYNTLDKSSLCTLLPGRSWNGIVNKASRLGIAEKNRIWTKKEDSIVLENFGKVLPCDLVKLFKGRTYHGIAARARILGVRGNKSYLNSISNKRIEVNQEFFNLATPLSSYWAGFIAADGCVLSNSNVVRVSISNKDKMHLCRFKSDSGFGGDVLEYVGTTSTIRGKVVKSGPMVRMNVGGVGFTWINKLKDIYNITPRKTKTLLPPIELDYINSLSYISGYIDGDGCLYINSVNKEGVLLRKRLYLEILGTKHLLEWIKCLFDSISPVKRSSSVIKKKGCYKYSVGGKRLFVLLDSLCSVNVPRLRRKWAPALDFVKQEGYNIDYNYYSF